MRWIFRLVGALLVLVLLAVGSLFLIPAEKIAGVAVQKFNDLTGRELVIEGSVRPSFWPQLGVRTGAIRISNAAWSDEGPMLRAEGLSIAIDMAALMGGEVKITGVEAIAPEIILERAKDGKENWVFGGANGGDVTTATPGVGKAFTLDKAVISGGRLTYIDHRAGSRVALSDIAATISIPDYNGAAALSIGAVKDGQAFSADLSLGAFRSFLDGDVGPVTLDLTAGAARVGFEGRAGWSPLAAEGSLDAKLASLAEVARLVGVAPPALPQGLGAKSVSVSGKVTVTEKASVHLRGGTVVLDGATLTADADLTTAGDRPKLSAKVTAGALDLRGLTGTEGGGADGGAKAAGWSKDRIDVSGLGALDAVVAITADSVDLGIAKLGASQLVATIDRARAVFDIRRIAAYDGTVSGQFVVNGRRGLSVGGDLSFAGLAMQPLLQDFGGYKRLIGTGDLRIKFLGVGDSLAAIMQGLEGSGSLALGKGEILGLDIGGMLRTLDTSYVGEGQKTIFDSIRGSFTINQGVLVNEDLALVSPYLSAKGSGSVGLGARTLNYRIKAVALADAEGNGGLTAPLLIKGTWADPKFSLDLEALAQENLAEEKAKLEAQARERAAALEAEARARLETELGITQQEGESLEDAARRRGQEVIEDEARRALELLLQGGQP